MGHGQVDGCHARRRSSSPCSLIVVLGAIAYLNVGLKRDTAIAGHRREDRAARPRVDRVGERQDPAEEAGQHQRRDDGQGRQRRRQRGRGRQARAAAAADRSEEPRDGGAEPHRQPEHGQVAARPDAGADRELEDRGEGSGGQPRRAWKRRPRPASSRASSSSAPGTISRGSRPTSRPPSRTRSRRSSASSRKRRTSTAPSTT